MTAIRNNKHASPNDHADLARVDKKSHVPAYAQLSQELRKRIADKSYPPGSCLPPETAMARQFGVSLMTVRQAVGLLVENGLVERVQGIGTFVRRIQVTESYFTFEGLHEILSQSELLQVKILKAKVEKPARPAMEPLGLTGEDSAIVVERLLFYKEEPILFQVAIARFNPKSPIVETLLESDILTGIGSKPNHANFKKGKLHLLPEVLGIREAGLLAEKPGTAVFKLVHTFYDFADQPAAFGWFLINPDRIPMISRIGVWNE